MQGGEAIATALKSDDAIQPGTFYYRYWLAEALLQCDRRDLVEPLLDDWFALLDCGLTTLPESARPSPRSDCHGWSVGGELIARQLFGANDASGAARQ